MFIDQVTIYCKGGDGGDGCLSFRREANVPRGGPDGGDGGRGGMVVVRTDQNISSLANIVGQKHWKAGRGQHGEGAERTGAYGKDVDILVPLGTIVRDADREHVLKDLSQDGDSVVVARGGRGGRGNKSFATSTNRAPREFAKGESGQERNVSLELKLIADVGLIGKPNAGKSTLLSRLSRANPEVGNYPFTTKYPNLGLVRVGYDHQFVVADIPGLIEGAHAGVGLGHEFLKHVERTKVLVHLIEPEPADQSDPIENYHKISKELRLHDASLLDRPEIIVVTKCEMPDAVAVAELLNEELHKSIRQISAVTGKGLPELIGEILQVLQRLEESDG